MDTVCEEVEVGTLSALDVKALRQCDHVSFHWHNGQGSVVCTKRVKADGPFDDRERRHEFAVRCSFYGNEGSKPRACFAMEYSYGDALQTIAAGLRPGDVVSLHWSADGHCNGYSKGAVVPPCCEQRDAVGMTLHIDTLHIKAVRGKQRMSWFAAMSICPDNSARMIRF